MTRLDRGLKRSFDIFAAAAGLAVLWPVIAVAIVLVRRDTGASGLFRQQRVGRHRQLFTLYKIRTMRAVAGTSITTANDVRITALGARLRRWKIDELPQLWNVLIGDMSFVGPRPDVPGYADRLTGRDLVINELRPGITGPATLKYRREEDLLAARDDPAHHNDAVIWPDKVAINREYYAQYSLGKDLRYLWQTLTGK